MSYFSIPKPSQELMERVSSLVQQEQQCTREIVFKLGEIEERAAGKPKTVVQDLSTTAR